MRTNETAEIALHVGEALLKLAGTYPSLEEVIKEAVQNALDGNARRIRIEFNRKENTFTVMDNGNGVSKALFQRALLSVGKGIKTETSLGRFGLGLISPLGKCKGFTFTSCPKPSVEGYKEWTLVTNKIRSQQSGVYIPLRKREDLRHESFRGKMRGSKRKVWWRTQVLAYDVTTDKIVTQMSLESLAEEINTQYSATIRKLKTTVEVVFIDEKGNKKETVVKGKAFSGKKLEEVEIKTGKETAIFRMFLVRQDKIRKGGRINLQFGEAGNDFRFSFACFARSYGGQLLSSEVMDALRSGIFEGEMLSSVARLRPNRSCFEKDDALLDFCLAIEEWFQNHGKKHLKEQREDRQGQRYQDLGIKSLKVLESLFKLNDSKGLVDAIKSFQRGTIGSGHFEKRGRTQEESSKSVGGEKKEKSSSPSDKKRNVPEKEKPDHMPFTAIGPTGKKRKIVKSNSLGLQICHEEIGGDHASKLWHMDTEYGVLIFNITHPLWARCDHSDAMICALQEHIVIQALTLLTMPDKDWAEHNRLYGDQVTQHFVAYLESGVRFARVRK